MIYTVLADLVLALHLAFLVFVVLGGLLLFRWPRAVWVHVPCAVWGVLTEFAGLVCPLTPLENALRYRAGEVGFTGDFIAHYLTATLYPAGLTRGTQILLGSFAVAVNAVVYWRVHVRRVRSKPSVGTDAGRDG